MIRLLRPLREPLGTPLMMPHHQLEKRILDHWGGKDSRSSFCKIRVQICRANTHEMRMRWIFSSAWSQSGHAGGWGSPRLARQSAVQHQLLMDNQTKNLHHKGAQLLQTCFQGANLMLPRKKALYADLLLYVPVIHSFHLCWSGTVGCKTRSSTSPQINRYSLSTSTVKAPLISATQHLLSKAWATVCCFTARLGISLHKFGASSDKVLPCNHLSNQNLVDFPLPTMVSTATLKSVLVYRGTWIGKPVQECDVSVFRAQNHQTQSALPRASRLWIPRPSYCRRC